MTKQLFLLIILIALLLLVSEIKQTTIQVLIVVPAELEPYVDWWLSFPGWPQLNEQLPNPQTMESNFCLEIAIVGCPWGSVIFATEIPKDPFGFLQA